MTKETGPEQTDTTHTPETGHAENTEEENPIEQTEQPHGQAENTGNKDKFAPKVPVQLNPPKDDPISKEELAKCDGTDDTRPILVAIKGVVFDVSGKDSYKPNNPYHVFAGKDASRALAKSSLKPEDCVPAWRDLEDKEQKTLDEWFTFFSKRYNIVGKVEGAENTEYEDNDD